MTLPLIAIGLGLGAAGWAHAQQGSSGFTAQLAMMNESGGSGSATATLNGDQLTINIHATGLTPNAPHAQHLHIGGTNTCPAASADTNGDGLVSTTEGAPSYGPIKVSLTTTGDVSDASGLAVDRFPKADANGTLDYNRTFALPAGVTAADLMKAVVVQHGVDVDKSGTYDGAAKSELDPSLPLEATLPADCGKGVAAAASTSPTASAAGSPTTTAATPAARPTTPSGVVAPNTGDGATAGGSDSLLQLVLIGGIALAIGGGAAMTYGFRKRG
jgi:hypothetical protein